MSLRSTKMIFAWIDTCGVRMSSPLTNSSTSSMRVATSVMMSALWLESATTAPRPFDTMEAMAGCSEVALA